MPKKFTEAELKLLAGLAVTAGVSFQALSDMPLEQVEELLGVVITTTAISQAAGYYPGGGDDTIEEDDKDG